ncbi:MAG: hypothetical protein POELPBGB_01904 [Bacteroidia bacterium]|nr:hypothetical protein [Bacteroidia bacterium]
MANSVFHTSFFENRYKRFAKKHLSLHKDLEALEKSLILNPEQGTNLGANLYKIRLAVESKGKGKSGGFRIITYLVKQDKEQTEIYMLTIYDKSEEGSIDKKLLLQLVKALFG